MRLRDRIVSGVAVTYGVPTSAARGAPAGTRIRPRAFADSLRDFMPALGLHHRRPIGQVIAYNDGAHCLEVVAVIDRPERNDLAARVLALMHSGRAYPPALSVSTGPTLWHGDELVAAALLEVSIVDRAACPGSGVYKLGLPDWAGALL